MTQMVQILSQNTRHKQRCRTETVTPEHTGLTERDISISSSTSSVGAGLAVDVGTHVKIFGL